MKFFDQWLEKLSDLAAEKVLVRLKAERPSQIGFRVQEPEHLHEAQWHHAPKEE